MRSKGYKCYNYHCESRMGDSSCCGEPGDAALDCMNRVVQDDMSDKRCANRKRRQHEDVSDG